MLCTSLMYHKIRPFLIIILESENLRTWFIRVKQKPQILLVQSLPLHRKMEARRVSWLDEGDMCKYSPPRCLLLLPAQGMGRNTNVSMGGRSPWPGFASSEPSFLILPLIGWCQSIFFLIYSFYQTLQECLGSVSQRQKKESVHLLCLCKLSSLEPLEMYHQTLGQGEDTH